MQQRVRFDTELLAGPKHNSRVNKPPSLLFSAYRCYLPGVKRPGPDVDHSSHLSVEVKNEPVLPLHAIVAVYFQSTTQHSDPV